MTKYIYAFLLLIGILSCENKSKVKEIQKIIDEVKIEYAPDSRTAIFNIKMENAQTVIISGETNDKKAKKSLMKRLQHAEISVKDETVLLPDESVGNKFLAIVNVSVANLRTAPKHSAELATQALLGTPVNLLKKESGWYLIQTPDKYIAWTNSGSITILDQAQFSNWKSSPKIIYLNTSGFSMNQSETQRVSDLVSGNILTLEDEREDHFLVSYPDNRLALIKKYEAELFDFWLDHTNLNQGGISNTAKELIGIPYLWGGTSTKGLDCSGFTKTVYLLHGIVLPRDASQQVHAGALVDKDKNFEQLQIGDLLFFGRITDDDKEHATHVGLWLGNNQFIHASSDVHISSMDSLADNFDAYNFNRYLRAKRINENNSEFVSEVKNLYTGISF